MILFSNETTRKEFNRVICYERDHIKEKEGIRKLSSNTYEHIFTWLSKDNTYRIVEVSFSKCDVDKLGFAREFFWQEYFIPVDEYGYFDHKDVFDRTKHTKGMHGIVLNHGTHEEPSWSIHT